MITAPAAVRFANEKIRPLADTLARAYQQARAVLGQFAAKGLGELIPDDKGEVIDDGSATDGRTPITGADIHAMLAVCTAVTGMADAGGGASLLQILKVAVNPE